MKDAGNGGEDAMQEASAPKGVRLSGTTSGQSSASARLSLSTALSIVHIQSAAFFARHSGAIERKYVEESSGVPASEELKADDKAYVTGAIFASIAFLEATINEMFDGTYQLSPDITSRLDAQTVAAMATKWEQDLRGKPQRGKPRLSTLEKYQLALQLARKVGIRTKSARFPPPVGSFPDVEWLTRLRDALIHYQPLWQGGQEQKDVVQLKGFLKSRFAAQRNPLVPPNSHFLHEYLCYACAKWAVDSALIFADDFYTHMGLQPSYEHMRGRLETQ